MRRAALFAVAVLAVRTHIQDRLDRDRAALLRHRPSYPFWAHVFDIPDGSVAFGSARDGRLLAVFPNGGDWTRDGRWRSPGWRPC